MLVGLRKCIVVSNVATVKENLRGNFASHSGESTSTKFECALPSWNTTGAKLERIDGTSVHQQVFLPNSGVIYSGHSLSTTVMSLATGNTTLHICSISESTMARFLSAS